jgi:hypothetical protein
LRFDSLKHDAPLNLRREAPANLKRHALSTTLVTLKRGVNDAKLANHAPAA